MTNGAIVEKVACNAAFVPEYTQRPFSLRKASAEATATAEAPRPTQTLLSRKALVIIKGAK